MAEQPRPTLFAAEDVFLLRAPLATGPSALPLPADGPGDPHACARLLAAAAADPLLDEAITLASPSLGALLRRVAESGPDGVRTGQLRRAALAVLRYDLRMRTRPTPFGLFAGVALGRFDVAAKYQRGAAHRTRTHADLQWLTRIGHRLEADPAVLASLTVQAHQALTARGDRFLLAASSTRGLRPGDDGEARATVSVRRSAVVEFCVEQAREPLPCAELAERIAAAFPGAPGERVRRLLADLVAQEILITGLRPPLDGGDPLHHVLDRLALVSGAGEETVGILEQLRELDRARRDYDAVPPGEGRAQLTALLAAARRTEPDDTPLHIDTRLDAELRLPADVRATVERAADVMWSLSRPKLGLFALRDYHRRFLDVYGTDRLVPVLDLLDAATGLGAPGGYGWPNSETPPVPPADFRTPRRDRAMARLAAAAQRERVREVVLTDDDLAELRHGPADEAELPNSCEITVQVTAPGTAALDRGEYLVHLSPSPGSHRAGATFARFADLDPDWAAPFAALHRDGPVHVEGAVPVDLAFRTRSGRAANLAHTRPATGRRIAVGLPDLPAGEVEELRIADIAVGATLERLTAVHLPTGRELVPVLGNMVSAPAQAPNPVRLLWEIGLEGQRLWEPWNWGPLADAPFVPRIRYGRFVLACAVWRLDGLRDHAERGRRAGRPTAGWDEAVHEWRTAWDVPRQVLAVTTDQRLPLDLDDPWHRALLLDQVLRHPDLIAQEVPGADEGWTDGELAGHTTELVVPLVRRRTAPATRRYTGHHQPRRTVHGLGDEWLYLKLHGSARTQDDLVRDRLPDLVDLARQHGADRWFFIRYTDEAGRHLRVRLHHPDPARLWGTAAPAVGRLLTAWQQGGLLRGHTVAEYDPETERYGGPAARRLVEDVFRHDSEAAVELLRLVRGPAADLGLDALAAVSCAALAHAFGTHADGPDDDAAAAWLGMTGSRRDLPPDYRARPGHWRALVDPAGDWPALTRHPAGERLLAALRPRDLAVRRLADHVRAADGATPQGRVVGSLLHMVCNRLFGGESARELAVLGLARGAVQDNLNRRRHQP
ncbi:lantibiotic dehydratase [Streptomyces sp. SP17BM10]|uniref:lantibiotic dehydratase n=1 Tax=Streptomyces sp. SP17BM10 TaxID=3002530 RepID=UPI002E792603|nr:lantibiotic dehydratase [Streptomyces sp. SP17BM10]MEE1786418.1 lantibiotic dehydratase [Streptomyces sp. SP17BM10]